MKDVTLSDLVTNGLPPGFDPEKDLPGIVQPLRTAARKLYLAAVNAQRTGAAEVKKARGSKDLTEDAKRRIQREQMEASRTTIGEASESYASAWRGFLAEANEAAMASLRPTSALPPYPSKHLDEDRRTLLDHVRAQAKVGEEVARRLVADRVDRMLERTFEADPAGLAVLQAYQRVQAAGDPLLLDVFEHEALARAGFAPETQREAVEAEILAARRARLPEPVQRLGTYAALFSGLDAWREAMVAEAGADTFYDDGGDRALLRAEAMTAIVGEPLAKFIGVGDLP